MDLCFACVRYNLCQRISLCAERKSATIYVTLKNWSLGKNVTFDSSDWA